METPDHDAEILSFHGRAVGNEGCVCPPTGGIEVSDLMRVGVITEDPIGEWRTAAPARGRHRPWSEGNQEPLLHNPRRSELGAAKAQVSHKNCLPNHG